VIPQESEILPIYTEYSSKWKKYLIHMYLLNIFIMSKYDLGSELVIL